MGVALTGNPHDESRLADEDLERLKEAIARRAPALHRRAPNDVAPGLAVLMRDREWALVAERAVDAAKHRHRAQLAQWSAVMMSTDDLAARIERLAQLNEQIYDLQEPMRALSRPDDFDQQMLDCARADVSREWQQIMRDSVVIREALMRDAGHTGWVYDGGRERLPKHVRAELEAADARRRIKRSVGPEGYFEQIRDESKRRHGLVARIRRLL
jgi:hypothetical protein